jgi:hypothetical protein
MDEVLKQELARFCTATAKAMAEITVAVAKLAERVEAIEAAQNQQHTTKEEF